MSRKADPSSRRSPRRRASAGLTPDPNLKVNRKEPLDSVDSDFGLCLALAPALRRRTDS